MIYIVEDDLNIRELEKYALENAGFEVCAFENATDFWAAYEKSVPRAVILDIMLPGEDGMEILAKLRRRGDSVRIMMITAKSEEMDKVRGLDGGADDYLTKPFGVLELVARVKALIRRTETASDAMVCGSIEIDLLRHSVKADGKECALTFKEFELLRMLIENKGKVLSRAALMERVWGFDFEGESRTLDIHINTLRKKLNTEAIRTVRNVGYIIEESEAVQ